MSQQIAVRLPDDLAKFVETQVAEGRAPSRAAVIAKALARERRRQLELADIEILRRLPNPDDFDDLATYAGRLPIDLD